MLDVALSWLSNIPRKVMNGTAAGPFQVQIGWTNGLSVVLSILQKKTKALYRVRVGFFSLKGMISLRKSKIKTNNTNNAVTWLTSQENCLRI